MDEIKAISHFTPMDGPGQRTVDWESKRKCRVQEQWLIKIVSGEYETFKVICKERWGRRTLWLPPKVGTAVAYEQTNIRGGLLLQEMVKIVKPN